MLYDTHCHPYLAKEKSQDEILENFFNTGGMYLNSIGCDIESSVKCIELAKKYDGVYASIGIHPTHCLKYRGCLSHTISELEAIYHENSDYIVAIGETGLDYHWLEKLSEEYTLDETKIISLQKDFFRSQIHLARKLQLPFIIHNRSSAEDVLEILREEGYTNFVFHCYSEDYNYAEKLLEFAPDCKLGFGGVTTFKSALTISEAAARIPLKNIIIETDSPYLTPTPLRGKEENEPLFCKHILSHLIDIRPEFAEEIQKHIFKNSTDFFLG